MPKPITSLEGYIRKLAKLEEKYPNSQLLFRGHSSAEHKISPSVFRSKNLRESEHLMLRQLLSAHPMEFRNDHGTFDQLVRCQHYGLPTRLLDVSINPLVALYFSVSTRPSSRGQVVVFRPEIAKQKYFDSDTVTLLAALALLTRGEKDAIIQSAGQAWEGSPTGALIIQEEQLEKFNTSPEVQKLIQLVRHEKPDFRPIVQPIDLAKPVSVVPRKLHNRILAQNGSFILFGLAEAPNELNMDHIQYETIDISERAKSRFLRELAQVGITESSLFPEIEKAAISIKKRYA